MRTNSSQNESQDEMGTNSSQILPTSEVQVRPLAKLEPQQQPEAWQQAVEQAGEQREKVRSGFSSQLHLYILNKTWFFSCDRIPKQAIYVPGCSTSQNRVAPQAEGKVPSGRIVKDVVQRIMEKTKVPDTYQIGEVCQILVKDNPELRGKGGCWGIVARVNDFSCTVKSWDGEYTVALQHLKSYNYLPAECKQMRQICDRISRVYSDLLEEAVKNLLQSLGKLNRPWLTAVEEKLLSVLESEYGREITH